MDEHGKSAKRLGLVALALAALSSPLVIKDAAAAGSGDSSIAGSNRPQNNNYIEAHDSKPQNHSTTGVGGHNNNFVTGHSTHNNNTISGHDAKPQNNNYIVGHDAPPGQNEH